MPRRSKLDWNRINELLTTVCPHCKSEIQCAECPRIDGEHLECPRCHARFIPEGKPILQLSRD
jgi:hypothetical protein